MGTEQVVIGIDVAKDWLDVGVQPTGETWRVASTPQEVRRLGRQLVKRAVRLVALEASGGYEVPVWTGLAAAGLAVAVLNARRVRDFARSQGVLAKTDRVDALMIAHYAPSQRRGAHGPTDGGGAGLGGAAGPAGGSWWRCAPRNSSAGPRPARWSARRWTGSSASWRRNWPRWTRRSPSGWRRRRKPSAGITCSRAWPGSAPSSAGPWWRTCPNWAP